MPGIIPEVTTSYKCTCDPGWSQPKLLNLTVLPFMPCIIPDCKYLYSRLNLELVLRAPRPSMHLCCSCCRCLMHAGTFDSSCYNFSLFSLRGIPLTDREYIYSSMY